MPLYIPSRSELEREERLLNEPLWREMRPALVELVERLQPASTDHDYFKLQWDLIVQVRARQQMLGELRQQRDDTRKQRSALAARRPKPIDELKVLQELLERLEHAIFVQEAIRFLLLGFGDGIAWRRLRYDRAAITVLGVGQRVGWLSDGDGWAAEVGALQSQWRQGVFALLNDLTTCLRHGDLTTFKATETTIYEVKAGGTASESSPQMVRLRDAITHINRRQTIVDGKLSTTERCPATYDTFLGLLPKLLARARAHGTATERPSACHFVVAYDMSHFTVDAGRVPPTLDELLPRSGWDLDGDLVLSMGATIRRMRDRHHSFATLAPLTIYPLKADDLADVLLGFLDFTVWVNVSAVARRLERGGYRAEAVAPPDSDRAFLQVQRRRGVTLEMCTVAPHLREMMLLELMTPRALEQSIDTLFAAMADAQPELEQTMVFMSDEAAVWEA